jgi:DNA-binding NarL/FixJ family response regulator
VSNVLKGNILTLDQLTGSEQAISEGLSNGLLNQQITDELFLRLNAVQVASLSGSRR